MPVCTEPMKAMRLTRGWRTSASPASAPVPVTMLTTPGGITSWAISARIEADSGLWSDGFSTMVLPAISGAAMREAAKLIGWLNGMMRPTTP